MLQKTKCSMQYLIRSATRAKNSIQHALATAYQSLPDTILMWYTGGLNLHFIPLRASSAAILTKFHFSTISRGSFSAPIKLVPLSDQIMAGVPQRDTNCSNLITQELVSMDVTISTRTARVGRQVKRKPHFSSVLRRLVSYNVAKQSTPVFVKGE